MRIVCCRGIRDWLPHHVIDEAQFAANPVSRGLRRCGLWADFKCEVVLANSDMIAICECGAGAGVDDDCVVSADVGVGENNVVVAAAADSGRRA
jgi:hypothetical protein